MPLQDWIHRLEEGGGAKFTQRLAAILAFIVVAAAYDSLAYRGLSTQEAMESAQLARNIATGKGYVTSSIQPLALYLLDRKNPGSARRALSEGVPDISSPPGYPWALASVMKVAPLNFNPKTPAFQPDFVIALFNQILLFFAALFLFSVSRRLFDARVAWLAVILFCGTELFWRFTLSGLSTILLEIIFLALIRVMIGLEESPRAKEPRSSIPWAIGLGILIGLGELTRFSFGWILLPALAFVAGVSRARWRNLLLVTAAFLVVVSPWHVRNFNLSGNALGTAAYAPLEGTPVFQDNQLERSLNPEAAFKQMRLVYLREKLLSNTREIISNELPLIGGNWLSAFFLVGLLIPFRNPALRQMRLFLLGLFIVWILVEAVGRTHLSTDSPCINSENLLALVAPLLFAYGAGLFYVLLDQLNLVTSALRAASVALFVVVLSLPLVLTAFSPPEISANSPYAPRWLQTTSRLIGDKELMMSDIPWAISWYGQRQCVNLTSDDSADFAHLNALKPVNVLFLTQRTTESSLLSQISGATNSWGRFFWDCWAHGEVPTHFPLQKAPVGYLPEQMLLSDRYDGRTGIDAKFYFSLNNFVKFSFDKFLLNP